MYTTYAQPASYFFTPFRCEVVTHTRNGNAHPVEFLDDESFWAQRKTHLQTVHPELTEVEVEKIIKLQERVADRFFDVWLKKRNSKIA